MKTFLPALVLCCLVCSVSAQTQPFHDFSAVTIKGDTISLGDVTIQLLHTPGHTPGSQCFYVHDHLVSGDTMFIGACGRCDGPSSSPEQMYHSLHSLASLPGGTILLPGHNYAAPKTSTIAAEAATNPFLQIDLQWFLRVVPGPGSRGR